MAPGPVTVDATMACCYRGGGLHDKVCQEGWLKRWVPQPTAKVLNECLGRCVSDVFIYDSGTPIR